MAADEAVTILLVDDDPDMRFLARSVLERGDMQVAAEAATGVEALEQLDELDPPPIPTVILLDNQMPGLTGVEVAARVLDEVPEQLIILFSAFLNDELVDEATRVGVTRCVSKTEALNLVEIVEEVVSARN